MKYLLLAYALVACGIFLISTGWWEHHLKTAAYGGLALLVAVVILCTEDDFI